MIVLDASAVLAHLYDEPGAERVQQAYADATISAANWSEVIGKAIGRGDDASRVRLLIDAGLLVAPVTTADAEQAAELRRHAWARPLSLGDRLCLALARRLGATALTADRAWADVVGIDVEVIR